MRVFLRTTLTLALLSLAGAALAQQPMQVSSAARATQLFTELDANRDGVVSQYEFDGDAVARLIDGNADRQVSKQEFDPLLGRSVDARTAGHVQVADSNDDGVMSEEEVRKGTYRQFMLLDMNRDGNLDRNELEAGFHIPQVRP